MSYNYHFFLQSTQQLHSFTEELATYNEAVATRPQRKSSKGKDREEPMQRDTGPYDPDTASNRLGTHRFIKLRKFIELATHRRWCGNWLDSSTVYSAGLPLFIQ